MDPSDDHGPARRKRPAAPTTEARLTVTVTPPDGEGVELTVDVDDPDRADWIGRVVPDGTDRAVPAGAGEVLSGFNGALAEARWVDDALVLHGRTAFGVGA